MTLDATGCVDCDWNEQEERLSFMSGAEAQLYKGTRKVGLQDLCPLRLRRPREAVTAALHLSGSPLAALACSSGCTGDLRAIGASDESVGRWIVLRWRLRGAGVWPSIAGAAALRPAAPSRTRHRLQPLGGAV